MFILLVIISLTEQPPVCSCGRTCSVRMPSGDGCSDVWWQPTFQGFRRDQQICWWRISVVCWSLFTVWWATTWEWSWSQENLNADIFFIKLMKSSINHHKSATCLFFLPHINLAVYSIYAMFVFSVFHQNKSKYPSKCTVSHFRHEGSLDQNNHSRRSLMMLWRSVKEHGSCRLYC